MIRIITVGKIKDKNIQNLINDYYSRTQHFYKIELIQIKEENKKEKETQNIERQIKEGLIIVLDETGKLLKSIELSNLIKEKQNNNITITFIIGNYYGLNDKIKQKAHFLLSLSKMTVTHEMAQLILIEQIYRAQTIIKGLPYHKE